MQHRLTLLALALTTAVAAQTPRNVLILVADDLGVDSLGCYAEGRNPPTTPNLDALARRGVLFRNAYANPTCSSTRCSLLTGRYPLRHLVGRWLSYANNTAPTIGTLRVSEWTFPKALRHAGTGHATACIGKWHVNDASEGISSPTSIGGFDTFIGTMAGHLPAYDSWWRVAGGVEQKSTIYATTQQTDDAIAWIAAQRGDWVCAVTYNAPHRPFHAPPSNLHTRNLTVNSSDREKYKAMVEAMDTEIGRLLGSLGTSLAHTHVIFLGDNGTPPNIPEAPFNYLRAKGTPYEGGINVPLIVAGPLVVSPGREVGALANMVDVFATTLEIAGASLPAWVETDGISLVPYLRSTTQAPLRSFVYAEEFTGNTWPSPLQNGYVAIREARYKLIQRIQGANELYDLQIDPFELFNLLSRSLTPEEARHHQALVREIQRLRAPLARLVPFGTGCHGTAGVPILGSSGTPRIGGSYQISLSNAQPNRLALATLGLSTTRWNTIPLPLDLRILGGPAGCELLTTGHFLFRSQTSSTGTASLQFNVPTTPQFLDMTVFHTWLIDDSRGLVNSGAVAAVIGL